MMWRRFIILLFIINITTLLFAQRPGVCMKGMNDRQKDQFVGAVKIVKTVTYEADFSRRVAENGEFISSSVRTYFENGEIDRERINDEQGQLLSLTIYQYRDGHKYVSTTYDANDTRTLQTLYDYNEDGVCTFMRLTDAIAVTISTNNIKHGENWVEMSERFRDGETVNERFIYDKKGHLIEHNKFGSADQTINTTYVIGKKGVATKAKIKQNGTKQTITYEYEFDTQGNWTKRITYAGGIAKEIATREISYY